MSNLLIMTFLKLFTETQKMQTDYNKNMKTTLNQE